MSKTPRTDGLLTYLHAGVPDDMIPRQDVDALANFARTLERELASQVTYAELLSAELREMGAEIGSAEWGNNMHAAALFFEFIEKWAPRIRAVLAKNPGLPAEPATDATAGAAGAGGAGTVTFEAQSTSAPGTVCGTSLRTEIAREPSMATFEIRSWLAPATSEGTQQIERLLAHLAELEGRAP